MSKTLLRELHTGDLPIFFEHQQDSEALHMAAFTAKDPADWDAFLKHWEKVSAENSGVLIRTILFDQQVAGHILTYAMDGNQECSYWIGRAFWGKGIATTALQQFLTVQTHRPLYARVAFDNVGSKRVLEKCGFCETGRGQWFANARSAEIEEIILQLDQ